ncbi:MAG: hypothetical protein ACE5KV_04235, partial [Thermoplasmata archaeon]
MIGRPSRICVGMLVILMVSALVVPTVIAEENGNPKRIAESDTRDQANQPYGKEGGYDFQVPPDVPRVSQSLLSKMNSKERVPIVVATTDISELSAALNSVDFDGVLGTERSSLEGISLPLLRVPGYAIERISSLPSTIFVEEFEPPVSYQAPSYEPLHSEYIIANNLNSTINHKANLAWSKNYTGKDVRIAVLDDGIDFAHPDLMGKMARVDSVFLVENETVVESAIQGQRLAALQNFDIVPSSYILYKNGQEMIGGYSLESSNGTITFFPPLTQGT